MVRWSSLTLLLGVLVLAPLARPAQAAEQNLRLGNPSGANATDHDNFLMEKPYFSLSYNDKKGTPNWVSWRLSAEDIGHAKRFPFHADTTLPSGFKRVITKDYNSTGFDRGHMCDHGDRSANDEMSEATFVMTNIIPQAPNVNRKAWEQFESYCRDIVQTGKVLYIVCGPSGQGGEGTDGSGTVIGDEHEVVVPAKCWKVALVLDRGGDNELATISASTRAIAVIMPNDMSVGEEWKGFRVSIADVEKLTGYHFFDKLPPSVLESLKQKVDNEFIPPPVPHMWNEIAH